MSLRAQFEQKKRQLEQQSREDDNHYTPRSFASPKRSQPPKPHNESRASDSYPFPVEYGDHFETPLEAYKDVAPVLSAVAKRLRKPTNTLAVYDPYYCKGAAVRQLAQLGFNKVHNVNEVRLSQRCTRSPYAHRSVRCALCTCVCSLCNA